MMPIIMHPKCLYSENRYPANMLAVGFVLIILILCLLREQAIFSTSLKQVDFAFFFLITCVGLKLCSESQRIHFQLATSMIPTVTKLLPVENMVEILSSITLMQKYTNPILSSDIRQKLGKKVVPNIRCGQFGGRS